MTVQDGDLLRVAARHKGINGQDIINVFAFAFAGTSDTDENVADAIEGWLNTTFGYFKSYVKNTQVSYDYKIDEVTWSGGHWTVVRNLGTFVWSNPNNPEGTGDALPPGVAGLIKLTTGLGKSYGRKFVAGLLESTQESGLMSGAVLTALANAATQMITGYEYIAGRTVTPVLLSEKTGFAHVFIDAVVNAVMSYQRRRRQNVGS